MSSVYNITIPPAQTVKLSLGQQFQFTVSSEVTICFSLNTLFPKEVSGCTYALLGNTVFGPYTAPSANTSINYNVVPGMQQCNPNLADTSKVIHVGSGVDQGHKR